MSVNFSSPGDGVVEDGKYRQFESIDSGEDGTGNVVMINHDFWMATNGVLVNTMVDGEPLFVTSAGLFHQ